MFKYCENNLIKEVNATRYIASWIKAGGKIVSDEDLDDFYGWLLSLGLDREDIVQLFFLATTGQMELEESAKDYLYFNKKINN